MKRVLKVLLVTLLLAIGLGETASAAAQVVVVRRPRRYYHRPYYRRPYYRHHYYHHY